MKFGMDLMLWTGAMEEEMLPVLERLKGLGFDGVEVPIFDYDERKWRDWGRRLDDLGLERTAVTARTAEDNPISADPAIRAKGVESNRRTLDCCHELGASTLVGPFHSALGVFSGTGPSRDEWQWAVDGMREVAVHADEVGVRLAVEYLNRFENYLLTCAADAVRFVEDVDHEACRMMYDTFHAHIEEKDVAEAIRMAAPYTIHVHISENDRGTPGEGQVRWNATFDALRATGYDGWLTIEAFGLALPELAAATKIWRRMYPSEEELARNGLRFMKQQFAKRW